MIYNTYHHPDIPLRRPRRALESTSRVSPA
ncbi:hypothetical protein PHL151M00_43 [Propionibacterium phage PHL151M00]|uniref:Uncharacterized protein n=2 Tax=Pahexavirus TaxID=1982251 RepID=A0A0E3DNZ6_9CAUD|nr:hypothetical protein PHL151M00_43 [Propionibacterium phage PHL151M00]YP_009603804.1 hypothetical protein FDH78_gp43 [Propionibacterium phage PHL151N00]AII29756.1 hypothetical protein PHL151M00_43 [Propionibacterium phage PHL151M00]AII29802.1 hypothetical protein PHL151N00_43 [Propionibacterium phage PHL151N00]